MKSFVRRTMQRNDAQLSRKKKTNGSNHPGCRVSSEAAKHQPLPHAPSRWVLGLTLTLPEQVLLFHRPFRRRGRCSLCRATAHSFVFAPLASSLRSTLLVCPSFWALSAFISKPEGLLSHHAPLQPVLVLPVSGNGQILKPKGRHRQPDFWWCQCCDPCGLVVSAPVDQMMWPPSQLLEDDDQRINIRKGRWQEKGTASLKWECIIRCRERQEV